MACFATDLQNMLLFLWKKMEICKKCIPNFQKTWYNVQEGKASNPKRKVRKRAFRFQYLPFWITPRATRALKIKDFQGFAELL